MNVFRRMISRVPIAAPRPARSVAASVVVPRPPRPVAAPALVIVGVFMMQSITEIDTADQGGDASV